MVNDHSPFGRYQYNPWAIELLRSYMDAVSRARDIDYSIPREIVRHTNTWGKVYFFSFFSLFLIGAVLFSAVGGGEVL